MRSRRLRFRPFTRTTYIAAVATPRSSGLTFGRNHQTFQISRAEKSLRGQAAIRSILRRFGDCQVYGTGQMLRARQARDCRFSAITKLLKYRRRFTHPGGCPVLPPLVMRRWLGLVIAFGNEPNTSCSNGVLKPSYLTIFQSFRAASVRLYNHQTVQISGAAGSSQFLPLQHFRLLIRLASLKPPHKSLRACWSLPSPAVALSFSAAQSDLLERGKSAQYGD